jgi:CRISPR-associated protein Cmr4
MNSKYSESDLYILQAVTNLHVGSGDNNFGIIDNQIQRDVTTNRPTINASSLKGGLREYFDPFEDDTQFVKYVFGSHPVKDRGNDSQKGAYSFLSANLLVLPLRSNTKAFFRATSPAIIEELLENITIFSISIKEKETLEKLSKLQPKEDEAIIFEELENTIIEDIKAVPNKLDANDLKTLENILGKDIAILSNNVFDNYCENLPVIARNHLEDGISQNLWYEEIVPRESRFYYIVTKSTNLDKDDSTRIGKFEKQFDTDELIQIGANATVGYGYTNIKKIEKV